jgi:phage gp46-like protein
MTDLLLDPQEFATDLAIASNDLVTDEGLETAIILSLFTDRRAAEEDVMPFGETDRRGWFGDAAPVVDGDKIGSRLWMLTREKQTNETLARAKQYCTEALAWLVEDLVASSVDVTVTYIDVGVMAIAIVVNKPAVDPVRFKWNYTWAAQQAKRG